MLQRSRFNASGNSQTTSVSQDRRLARVISHVTNHWFPTNQSVLNTVNKGIRSGAYEIDSAFLLNDLRSDFALLTFVVRELRMLGLKSGLNKSILKDPLQLFAWAGTDRLQEVVNSAASKRSHLLSDSEEFQSKRIDQTAITATTVELLADSRNLNSADGYIECIFKEVGLHLIAWNYPSVYERALQKIKNGSNLENEISKELGFSPSLLASAIMWPNSSMVEEARSPYHDLIVIGETLARANDPESYPSAEADWEKSKNAVQEILGPSGIEQIRKKVIENTKQYCESHPTLFPKESRFNPQSHIERHRDLVSAQDNPYLKLCPPIVKDRLVNLYSRRDPQIVDKELISDFVKRIVPSCGFSGGCIYVLDPTSGMLHPRISVGTLKYRNQDPVKISSPTTIKSVLVSETFSDRRKPILDMVYSAFECDSPLIEEELDPSSHRSISCIAGAFGIKRKVGVLYLECDSTTLPEPTHIYKALRHTLGDLFNIN